jgi:SAM-dependent methyltransferase
MGRHQLDFLVAQGLAPSHRFLDVGCGSLRAGRHLVSYLDPGNYYGLDVNLPVIEAGYERELTASQRERLPEGNLRATDRFFADFGVEFDMAIAQSVFSHLSLNHLRLCLWRVGRVMRPGGTFFVTFFERGDDFPIDGVDDDRSLHTERNNYWYYRGDMEWATERTPWEFRYHGDWNHPRGQRMVAYTRTGDAS